MDWQQLMLSQTVGNPSIQRYLSATGFKHLQQTKLTGAH
jgi:hypothetical protein